MELDWPTADLAIFDIVLLVIRRVDQDVNSLTAVRAVDGSLLQFTHDFEVRR